MSYRIFKVDYNEILNKEEDNAFVEITDNTTYKIASTINQVITRKDLTKYDTIKVDFLIVPLEALSNWYFFVQFAKSKFRKFIGNKHYKPNPVVFITSFNVFHNYHLFDENSKKKDYYKRKDDFERRTKYFNIDKRYEFMDSSIWHYYLPIEEWCDKEFKKNLKIIIEKIANNYELNLYNTVVAKEYLEFQTRMMRSSYLEDIGKEHSEHIAPFVFHSETRMKHKADNKLKELKELCKKVGTTIEWNVYIVDDYAKEKLKPNNTSKNCSKGEIIEEILKQEYDDTKDKGIVTNIDSVDYNCEDKVRFQFNYSNTSKTNVLSDFAMHLTLSDTKKLLKERLPEILDCKENEIDNEKLSNVTHKDKISELNEFLTKDLEHIFTYEYSAEDTSLKKTIVEKIINIIEKEDDEKIKPDIILLDYLLGENTETGKREFGHELFIDPRYKKLTQTKGPLGKYWFFPITSFSRAMLDKIKGAGVDHINDHWYLFEGADPIATPQLFRYNLFKLMELQLRQVLVTPKEIIEFIDTNGLEREGIRQTARYIYGNFMHKFGLREALKEDARNDSAFAKSITEYMENHKQPDIQFYEYTRKLLYLLGYGTHYKAPRMWDLLNYISMEVKSLDDSELKNKATNFIEIVADYINDLTDRE